MPFNGSGVFTRVYNWVSDAAAAIPITAARVDAEDDGYATGLSNVICKDGQTTITADLPMAGFKHTGVANAAARAQYAVVGQIQDSTYNWVAGGGTGDAITATYAPAVTALVDGMELSFRAPGANTLTTPSFSPNGITAHTITKNGGSALAVSDIPAALFEGKLRYNLANTRWELQNPVASVVTSPFIDSTAIIKGSGDATKLFRIEVDGFTTGTTRVMTPPDADFTPAVSTRTISAAGLATGGGDLSANRTITVTAAVQSDMEAATSTTTAVVPGVVKNHPGVAKAWVTFDGTASSPITPLAQYGINGNITKNGTGDYSITFTTAFSSTNYAVIGSGADNATTNCCVVGIDNSNLPTTTVARITTRKDNGALTDFVRVNVVFFGDQ